LTDRQSKYLSFPIIPIPRAIRNSQSPSFAIIFGGGISKEGETLLAPLREIIDRECYSTYGKKPTLLIAELGNDAGIIGAAFFGE
jgi:glucokinase